MQSALKNMKKPWISRTLRIETEIFLDNIKHEFKSERPPDLGEAVDFPFESRSSIRQEKFDWLSRPDFLTLDRDSFKLQDGWLERFSYRSDLKSQSW